MSSVRDPARSGASTHNGERVLDLVAIGPTAEERGRKANVDIHRFDKNEGKTAVAGWEIGSGKKNKASGWSTAMPGDSVAPSAKAERKRMREMEMKNLAKAEAAAKAAAKAEPPRKRAKVTMAETSSLADFAAEVVVDTSDVAQPAEGGVSERRVVLLMQPASVRTGDGKFRKGHMAELKSALEAAGEVEYLNAVADSLELQVVFTEVEGAKRALKIEGVGKLRRLSSSDASIFFSAQKEKIDASRAKKEKKIAEMDVKRAAKKGKGKGGGKGGGRGGKGGEGDEGKGGGKGGKGKGAGKGRGKGHKEYNTVSFA